MSIVYQTIKILFSIWLIAGCHCGRGNPSVPVYSYELKITADHEREVNVTAVLHVDQPYLTMQGGGIPLSIANGWAAFVTIKSMVDADGEKIGYVWEAPTRRWKLDMAKPGTVRVHYAVSLSHDKHDWNSVGGIDGRPTVISKGSLFWITKGLFVFPVSQPNAVSEVTFDVPPTWKISTAWTSMAKDSFRAEDIATLTNNALMIGSHEQRKVVHDGMQVTIAVATDLAHRAALLEETLSLILPVYKEIFGELPEANYLICASKNFYEDGEAFYNSFHQMFIDQNLESRKIVWANVLAHEMFHYWNGTHFLVGEDYATNSWFSEGFTEYYSNLALIRAGIVKREEYLAKLAYQFSRFYNAQAFATGGRNRMSLFEAGKEKGANWNLIYGGGASIAFMLDVEIRNSSGGQKSLDDLMQALYHQFGKNHKPMTIGHQLDVIQSLTDYDVELFFRKYVQGTEFYLLPILQACKKAGIIVAQYQGEFYLKTNGEDANRIIDQIISQH